MEYQGDAAVHGPCVSCLHEARLTWAETGQEDIIQDSRCCHNDRLRRLGYGALTCSTILDACVRRHDEGG